MNYTFIIPFYNEDQNVLTLNDEIINNIKKIKDEKRNFEIIYIDDGSSDNTFDKLKKLNTNNIDTTIILQEPKIVNYRNQIKKNICSILNINQSQLSIKATTTDGLGFIGLGEGIASHAISLIKYHGS